MWSWVADKIFELEHAWCSAEYTHKRPETLNFILIAAQTFDPIEAPAHLIDYDYLIEIFL